MVNYVLQRDIGEHPESDVNDIGKRLKSLRLKAGLSQQALGAPKYTHAYVSLIEGGRRRPSRRALEHFANKLQLDVEELSTGRPRDLEPRLAFELQDARLALSAGRVDEARSAFGRIARQARRFDLVRLEARAEQGLGLLLERQGDSEGGLQHYEKAEALLKSEPPTARADAVAGKARCFLALGDARYAIHLLESLLESIEQSGLRDPDALARVLASLVDAYLDAGLENRAAEAGRELERLAPDLSEGPRLAQMYMNVARLYLYEGKGADAQHALSRAENLYGRLNLASEKAGALLAQGYVLSREGKLREASARLKAAIKTFEQTEDHKDLARALNEYARVERLQGRQERAAELLHRSIELLELKAADTPILAWAHRELGLTLADADPTVAEKHFRIAMELFERSEQVVEFAATCRTLGDLLQQRGEWRAGCEMYRTGILAVESKH